MVPEASCSDTSHMVVRATKVHPDQALDVVRRPRDTRRADTTADLTNAEEGEEEEKKKIRTVKANKISKLKSSLRVFIV